MTQDQPLQLDIRDAANSAAQDAASISERHAIETARLMAALRAQSEQIEQLQAQLEEAKNAQTEDSSNSTRNRQEEYPTGSVPIRQNTEGDNSSSKTSVGAD